MGLGATQAGAAGQATAYTNLANLAQQYGENQANVYGNVEGATIGANNLAAAGQAAGAKNLLGAGLSLATLGLGGGFGGGGGGGGGSSLLGGMFGGWQGTPTTAQQSQVASNPALFQSTPNVPYIGYGA
jgi:hypothetical protein